ncbi:uncharacterized protein EI90DRAFT_3019063 [Cantharellus anzutake]|uniref:uncharacterized protein n=1 Tax=Cantharellus anzutake TaxID=1750568 RepID=UPI001905AAB3|nr:uncharacterized protein EI90DRAFT_3019063 [Cantharellus anzutake]KAF8325417.1 hypothetical protein EI90DRAFT_3019063 [Cantharellus anzutake]
MRQHVANEQGLLVFKDTGNKTHHGHVSDTRCRPDITAAFERDWLEDGTVHWSCVRLAGEQASKDEQKKNAISYLHYLLLARPDLYVAPGLLTSKAGIIFLLGIAGDGIRRFSLPWNHNDLYKPLYAFIYRLYKPDNFADPSYSGPFVVDPKETTRNYSWRINLQVTTRDRGAHVLDFSPIFASNPFGTRTHVLSNPSFQFEVEGKALTVLKEQLCRTGTRFDEQTILTHIHKPERVPGVVEAVYHETIEIPYLMGKNKHRLGLRQSGLPFTSIPTPRKVLETLFDVLEVLRYMRFHRQVLHRDISRGNVLYTQEPSSLEPDTQSVGAEATASKELPLCFIKYLLRESNDPCQTSALLIDFNHAEHLGNKQGSEHQRTERTGTPIFISRAVEMGGPVSLADIAQVPAVPNSPEIYTLNHPDRIKKFPLIEKLVVEGPLAAGGGHDWRHELDHDAESVFWLLVYWAMVVQPLQRQGPSEYVDPATWTSLIGAANHRGALVTSLARGLDITHSMYKPLHTLISKLAAILIVDRHWLPESDVRNDPEYINEAFQRLILQFILDHHHETFMDHHVDTRFPTTSQRMDAVRRKRVSPQPLMEAGVKRRCLGVERTEVEGENMRGEEVADINEWW